MFLVNSCSAITLILYLTIAVSQLLMRKKIEKEKPDALEIKMWLFPYLTYFTIFAISALLIAMFFIESMRTQILFTGVLTIIVIFSYIFKQKKKTNDIDNEETMLTNREMGEKI